MTSSVVKKWFAIGGASVAFYSLVTATALALFLPRASLKEIAFTTGSLALKVSKHQVTHPNPDSYQIEVDFSGTDRLLAGGPAIEEDFWVKNFSSPGQPLSLYGQLSTGSFDWEALKHVIEIKLQTFDGEHQLDWLTLAQWSESAVMFPGTKISDDTQRRYLFLFRMRDTYPTDPDGAGPLQANSPIGPELQGKKTGNLTFTIEGRLQ